MILMKIFLRFTLIWYLLSIFYYNADALVPSCDNGYKEVCRCHPSYNKYNEKLQSDRNLTDNCLKIFLTKLDFDSASKTCENEHSFIFQNSINDAFQQDLKDQGINLIWVGIRRVSGFYATVGNNEPSIFKESNRDWGKKWSLGEPVYDCVALNLTSKLLVTRDCSNELQFVCQNSGFPIYPIERSLACPDDWLFFYQLPLSRKKCLRILKSDSLAEANQTCISSGGDIADLALHVYLNKFAVSHKSSAENGSITSTQKPSLFFQFGDPNLWNKPRLNRTSNNTKSCENSNLLSFLGPAVSKNLYLNCSDKLFICERDTKRVSLFVQVTPRIPDAFPSYHTHQKLLTCHVELDGRAINGTRNQVLFQWFKNGMAISEDSHLLQVGFYSDTTKSYALRENDQGTYRCRARVAGLRETYMSQEVHYFYSDISTYILTVQGYKQEYQDFSQIGFRGFKANLKRSMRDFTKDLKTYFPNLLWDFQNFSLNGNVSTVKMLLYIKRNESLYTKLKNETEVHRLLQKYIIENKFVSKAWKQNTISLHSADVCFMEAIPSSQTSYEGDLMWYDSLQTKVAMSDPICLNGWKLVTRECKPSTVVAAKWMLFNYSLCSQYQNVLQGPKVNCPDGFHELKPNLCYSVNTEGRTFDEANEICRNSSSYLMDSKTFDLFPNLEQSTRVWISEKFISSNVNYLYMAIHPQKSNTSLSTFSFNCASVLSNERYYNIRLENCNEIFNFICINQPIKLLSSTKLSTTWDRLSSQRSCFYPSSNHATWSEAKDSCLSLSKKSKLLQSIQNVEDYNLFKVLMHSNARLRAKGSIFIDQSFEWWIDLIQDEDSLLWSGLRTVQYVDWNAHTNFSMRKSAGVLEFDASDEIRWNLKDTLSKRGFVCEMQDCADSRPTLAYIEDRTVSNTTRTNHTAVLEEFKLYCIPSGWFVSNSITWFKDGILILSNSESNELRFKVLEGASLEDILLFQGYYWCSVDQLYPFKTVYSSKSLFRLPGLYTFVLYMEEQNAISDCSDFRHTLKLPPIFMDSLNETVDGFKFALMQNATCERSVVHYYIHIHIKKNIEDEGQVLRNVESSILSSVMVFDKFWPQIYKSFLRSTESCKEETVTFHGHSTTWPTTLIGQSTLSNELCVGENGDVIERKCLGDFNVGAFWEPVQKECVHASSTLTVNLHKLSKVKITMDNILNTSLEMETLTATSEGLNSADIQYVAQILRNMATVQAIQTNVFSSVINTVDSVIGVERLRVEDKHSNFNLSSKISGAVENMLSNLNTNGHVFKSAGSNIAISVFPHNDNITLIQTGGILESWSSNLTTLFNGTDKMELYSSFEEMEAGILLPEYLVARSQSGIGEDVAIVVHRNIHYVKNFEVVSPIIAVSVGSHQVYDMDPPVEMIFKVPEVEKNVSYECVYWDQSMNNNFGGWSYKGCILRYLDPTHVRCSCDHLTSFAVILELKPGSKISEVHQKALSSITYIGCALSIFGLGVIILTFALFRQWRKDLKHKALFHLSLALFSFLLTFVAGVEKRGGSVLGCMAVAALLHFFMLASFAWMLVEAFMQYLSLVKVIGTYIPRFMQKAVLFAWGVPVIVVGIMLSINYNLYTSKHKYCWVSDRAFYYAVAGPVLAMLAMNFVIFGCILYSNTCGRPKKYLRTNRNERQETITRAKAIFCVSILLGLSWTFGFLAVDGAKLVFQYLFAVTTTLQGFFIFIFFVVRQKNTRDLWLNLFTPASTPEISHITGGTDVASKAINQQNRLSKAVFKARLSYVSFNR